MDDKFIFMSSIVVTMKEVEGFPEFSYPVATWKSNYLPYAYVSRSIMDELCPGWFPLIHGMIVILYDLPVELIGYNDDRVLVKKVEL